MLLPLFSFISTEFPLAEPTFVYRIPRPRKTLLAEPGERIPRTGTDSANFFGLIPRFSGNSSHPVDIAPPTLNLGSSEGHSKETFPRVSSTGEVPGS